MRKRTENPRSTRGESAPQSGKKFGAPVPEVFVKRGWRLAVGNFNPTLQSGEGGGRHKVGGTKSTGELGKI